MVDVMHNHYGIFAVTPAGPQRSSVLVRCISSGSASSMLIIMAFCVRETVSHCGWLHLSSLLSVIDKIYQPQKALMLRTNWTFNHDGSMVTNKYLML